MMTLQIVAGSCLLWGGLCGFVRGLEVVFGRSGGRHRVGGDQ